ncbi:hypothetical protein [Methylobacterium nodulans]|nr:hypothetical protein [Methylobacterium nodulans]
MGSVEAAPACAALTVIRSADPSHVGKRFFLDQGGKLDKRAVAHVTAGVAQTRAVPDAEALAALLTEVTESTDLAFCSGTFHGAGDEPFRQVTERRLADLLGSAGAPPGGVQTIGGERVAARVKRGIDPSPWLLLDADDPAGMRAEWVGMPIAGRLELLEAIIPGVSSVERVEYRSSTARVSKIGEPPGERTHAWIRVSHPEKIERLRAAVRIAAVNADLAFASPRYSRTEPGKVTGSDWRTLIDLAVWDHGRLVFVARPDVQDAPGREVHDAGVRIVNAGGRPARPLVGGAARHAGVRHVQGAHRPGDQLQRRRRDDHRPRRVLAPSGHGDRAPGRREDA